MNPKFSTHDIDHCPIENDFLRFVNDFDEYVKQQLEYQNTAREAIEKVNSMHETIHEGTNHLSCLPDIAKTLADLRDTSFNAAIGRKQVPMSIFLIVVTIMGLVIILRELGDRKLDANLSGVKINQGQ